MGRAQRDVIARYVISTATPQEAAAALARGQSIGNPTAHTPWDRRLKRYEAEVLSVSETNPSLVTIRFPRLLFGRFPDPTHLMTVLLGGQCDIDRIKSCRLTDLQHAEEMFPGPRYGIRGLRELLRCATRRPLLGVVIKPKVGLQPHQLAALCADVAVGGADFIKEDEIMATSAAQAPFIARVSAVARQLARFKRRVLYAPCINGPSIMAMKDAEQLGATAIHINIWAGLSAYLYARQATTLPIFFQRSGMQVFTRGPYAIDETVLYRLITAIGCDFGHIGMLGGYHSDDPDVLRMWIEAMAPAMPSFSCGLEPRHVPSILTAFGPDVMLTSGGFVHSHPQGPRAGVEELRRAINDATRALQPHARRVVRRGL